MRRFLDHHTVGEKKKELFPHTRDMSEPGVVLKKIKYA